MISMKYFRTYSKSNGKIDLSMVKNPLGTSSGAKQAVMRNLDKMHIYCGESEELLKLIAKRNGLKKENVLITAGADSALTLIALAFFKGKKIILPAPCFPRFEFYAKVSGGKPIFVSPKKDLSVNEHSVLSSKRGILLISSPDNPTGFSVSKEFIIKSLKKFELVVLDETLMLSENGYENLLKKFDNLIITRSFSKLYGLAGMRIGYAIGSKRNISALREISSPYPVSVLSQAAAFEAMVDKNFVEKSTAFIEKERKFLYNKIKNENIIKSRAISYVLPLDNFPKNKISERISVAASDGFRFLPKDFVRISIGNRYENEMLIRNLGVG